MITLDLQPASTDRITTTKLPGKKFHQRVKYLTLSAWMERQGTHQTRIAIERRMCHWLAAPQNSGYKACQARKYALDGVGCRPVGDSTHHPTTHSAVFFFASPRQFLPALDNHPESSPANPKPCRCSTEEQPRKNLLTGRNAPPAKNCPSGRTPRANDKLITLFGADIPCNATKTSERHEPPLHMCFGCDTGSRSGAVKC